MRNRPTTVASGLAPRVAERVMLLLLAMGIPAELVNHGWRSCDVVVPPEHAADAEALIADEFPDGIRLPPPLVRPKPEPIPAPWLARGREVVFGLFMLCVVIHLQLHDGMDGASRSRMIEFGAILRHLVDNGESWRLLTAVFLHFDSKHLVGNMGTYLLIAPPVAHMMGSSRFLATFLATGLGANIISHLLTPISGLKAGASGAIAGILGALAGQALREGRRPLRAQPWHVIGALLGFYAILIGFGPGRDNTAHVAGLLLGVLAGRFLSRPPEFGPGESGVGSEGGAGTDGTGTDGTETAPTEQEDYGSHTADGPRISAEDVRPPTFRGFSCLAALCGTGLWATMLWATMVWATVAPGDVAWATEPLATPPGNPAGTIPPGRIPAGTILTGEVPEFARAQVTPAIDWALRRGARIEVVDPKPIPLEPARLEATQRYSAQCKLSEDRSHVENYVAGLPFPLIDPNDPDIALKLLFNYENRIVVDDLDIRNFECDTGALTNRGLRVERHFQIEHFRRLYYVSRLYHDPRPTWETPHNVRYREVMHPIIEPFDLKGVGLTYTRYSDPYRQDDSWLYYPLLKRVRRLSSAQRSDALFGQDADIDSYGGFAGNPAWMNWRLLGIKTILGAMHTRHLPARYREGPGEFLFDDTWESRDVYVLEGESRLPGYAYSKRVIYLDRQSFVIPYSEMYDREGQLWKAWVNQWKLGREPFPGARRAVYDYDQQFIPALSVFDMQLDHATRCRLPSPKFPGEEGWYFNFGDAEGTTEEVFSVSSILASGR